MAEPSDISSHPRFVGRPLKSGDSDGTSGGMDARVAKLEGEMVDVRITLARIDEKLAHIATKEDLAKLGGEVAAVREAVASKLGYWQFLLTGVGLAGVLIAFLTFLLRPEVLGIANP